MRVFYVCLIVLSCSLSNAFADEEMSQYPYVTASDDGRYFFLMKSDPNDIYNREKGTGICYEVTRNGEFKELWRTEGWYSFETFLVSAIDSNEHPKMLHQYLVRLGNWPRGHKLSADNIGVGFYKDGKLLKLYSTADLVHNESAIHPSVSHYQFLDTKFKPTLEYKYEKNQWVFKLVTIDGIHYQFDVKTGEILLADTSLPPKKSGEQQPSEG
jgi:muconolactone delta-isomerase